METLKKAFVIEKTINAPAVDVWKAISDKDEMKLWYFDLAEFKAEVGFKFEFSAGESPEKEYLHRCIIKVVEVYKKLMYSWEYPGYEGISYVTFELEARGNETHLKLTHEGLDSFPTSNKDFAPENFAMGWTDIIGNILPKYLAEKTHS